MLTVATSENTDVAAMKPAAPEERKNENVHPILPSLGQPSLSGASSQTATDGDPTPLGTNEKTSSRTPAPQPQRSTTDKMSEGLIKYRVEYINPTNTVIHQHDVDGPHFGDSSKSQKQVFTIVTTLKTTKQRFEDGEEISGTGPTKSMHISSKSVEQALRAVVEYYPSQDLATDVIKIQFPYAVLVHNYDRLMEYRERFNPEKLPESAEVCFRERNTYEHLGVLKDFLDETIMPAVKEERERNKRGMETFDMQWVAREPGQIILGYHRSLKMTIAAVIHSISDGSFVTPSMPWTVKYWSLDYGGYFVGRSLVEYIEAKYTGEREVKDTIGVDFTQFPRAPVVEQAIENGKIYWNLLQKQCKHYRGKTHAFPHNEVDGLVMCDLDAYYESVPGGIPTLMDMTGDNRTWVSDCTCSVCGKRRDANVGKDKHKFEDFYAIFVREEELRDQQYLLLPSLVRTYVFRTRTWETLHVSGFSKPDYDADMINNLVMDSKRVEMLKALARSFARVNRHGEPSKREPWSADFVKGKGNGLIFLLHGKPGVGKTCTAECIAAYTKRPLMVLTSSDIGTSPKEVEENLTSHFKRARRWGAVLLIDEADVFMERRSTADLTRNSLVAGFLRALEFYDGILFLTTNRVGSFDDAFISRIHVHLYYPDFDDDSRAKVWKTFTEKLERERSDYIRLSLKAEEYIDSDEIKAMKWNGREIRNAFQTAVALAEYEDTKDREGKIVLTDKHLKSVVEMSRDFKTYLNELHAGDEGKRAERRYERLDI